MPSCFWLALGAPGHSGQSITPATHHDAGNVWPLQAYESNNPEDRRRSRSAVHTRRASCWATSGKPAIHILFQHGKFTAHSSALTSIALFGYAVGLPGLTAIALLVTCFYSLTDARTPLFTGIGALVVHIALLLLLFHLLTGRYTILAIPLAASIAGTAETGCLSLILFIRLRKKVRTDKGWSRLKTRRLHGARTPVEVPL